MRRLLDSPWTYFALAAALLAAALATLVDVRIGGRAAGGPADLRALRVRGDASVLFVLIDTLRADRLGAYGYPRATTPTLDALAARGVRFARVEAQSSWTKCSMASLWTGVLPTRIGVTRFDHALPAEATTAAEVLRAAGLRTAGVWRNGWVAPSFGFDQGFETYLRPAPGRDPERFERRGPAKMPLHGTDEDATRAAIAFLDAHGSERFLLYVHYMDLHQYAYDAVAAELGFGTSYSDHYDAALHWVDRNVAALLDALAARGLAGRTLVAVAADHGEGFLEHGLEGHARTLYAEVTRVPFLVSLPFRLPRGAVVEAMVRNLDVWPTLLDLLGLPPLPAADGRSALPLVEAAVEATVADPGAAPARDALHRELGPAIAFLDRRWGRPGEPPAALVSVRSRGRALILAAADGGGGAHQLYDLASDPGEQRDLARAGPPPAWGEELLALARGELAARPGFGPAPRVALDALELDHLRALGYVAR
jgi:arylsulfatase A-like enzyme